MRNKETAGAARSGHNVAGCRKRGLKSLLILQLRKRMHAALIALARFIWPGGSVVITGPHIPEPPVSDDDTQPSVRLVGDWHRPCHTPDDDNGWRIVE